MTDSTASKDATLSIVEQLQAELKGIQDQYASISSTQPANSADTKVALDSLLQQLRNVQSSFQASAVSIPGRDQRTLSEAISSLSTALATSRTAAQPRAKFAFKKKAAAPSSAPSPTTAISSVATTSTPTTTSNTATISSSSGSIPVFPPLSSRPVRRPELPPPLVLRHQVDEDIRPLPTSGASTVSHLSSCLLLLPSGQEGLHLSHCTRSLLILNSVAGAVHLTSLSHCVVVVAARQVRLHASTDVDVYLACGSEPVMEDCERIRVGRLPPTWSGWHAGTDLWDAWRDFSWVADGVNPHWRVLKDDETVSQEVWQDVVNENKDRATILEPLGIQESGPAAL